MGDGGERLVRHRDVRQPAKVADGGPRPRQDHQVGAVQLRGGEPEKRADDRGFRVLTTRAAAAESVLAYAALADLLHGVEESTWADLPAPQQQGLDAALLRRRDDAQNTDPRAVAAAFVAVFGTDSSRPITRARCPARSSSVG